MPPGSLLHGRVIASGPTVVKIVIVVEMIMHGPILVVSLIQPVVTQHLVGCGPPVGPVFQHGQQEGGEQLCLCMASQTQLSKREIAEKCLLMNVVNQSEKQERRKQAVIGVSASGESLARRGIGHQQDP